MSLSESPSSTPWNMKPSAAIVRLLEDAKWNLETKTDSLKKQQSMVKRRQATVVADNAAMGKQTAYEIGQNVLKVNHRLRLLREAKERATTLSKELRDCENRVEDLQKGFATAKANEAADAHVTAAANSKKRKAPLPEPKSAAKKRKASPAEAEEAEKAERKRKACFEEPEKPAKKQMTEAAAATSMARQSVHAKEMKIIRASKALTNKIKPVKAKADVCCRAPTNRFQLTETFMTRKRAKAADEDSKPVSTAPRRAETSRQSRNKNRGAASKDKPRSLAPRVSRVSKRASPQTLEANKKPQIGKDQKLEPRPTAEQSATATATAGGQMRIAKGEKEDSIIREDQQTRAEEPLGESGSAATDADGKDSKPEGKSRLMKPEQEEKLEPSQAPKLESEQKAASEEKPQIEEKPPFEEKLPSEEKPQPRDKSQPKTKIYPPRGLVNRRNACFSNVVIQLLDAALEGHDPTALLGAPFGDESSQSSKKIAEIKAMIRDAAASGNTAAVSPARHLRTLLAKMHQAPSEDGMIETTPSPVLFQSVLAHGDPTNESVQHSSSAVR